MKRIIGIIFLLLAAGLFSSCGFHGGDVIFGSGNYIIIDCENSCGAIELCSEYLQENPSDKEEVSCAEKSAAATTFGPAAPETSLKEKAESFLSGLAGWLHGLRWRQWEFWPFLY